tara:strand:- start:69 stop:278 length:210 start_codon:yes stop_codon:yes gene_type:complete
MEVAFDIWVYFWICQEVFDREPVKDFTIGIGKVLSISFGFLNIIWVVVVEDGETIRKIDIICSGTPDIC